MSKNDQKTTTTPLDNELVPFLEKDSTPSVVEIKFLATSWLDDFEKTIFNGKTVNQILNPQRYE